MKLMITNSVYYHTICCDRGSLIGDNVNVSVRRGGVLSQNRVLIKDNNIELYVKLSIGSLILLIGAVYSIFFSNCKFLLTIPLLYLYYLSLSTSTFPAVWKTICEDQHGFISGKSTTTRIKIVSCFNSKYS
ncbi:LINE-1 reverse transcriptase [Aphis craccivora]|uniref:LINE-1 reverse transcriptase n=1 Tax=Aphis craccivora TaxID=307492 RepID=A0A6G0YW09_APHCR|nr:LINE-1 reverse transcriptase [Aphis craccivora]